MTVVLGIETSCDETAAALVEDGRRVRASLVASQVQLHARYGGIVPEVASRHHLELLHPLVCEAMERAAVGPEEIDAVAVTCGPGLVGALLVGVAYAKALARAWQRPLVAVNHLEGHLFAPWMEQTEDRFPHLSLVVSGGHTSLYRVAGWGRYETLGRTRDDAIGEAYDKVAKYLGLGYPGGPVIDRLAGETDDSAFDLPRPMQQGPGYDTSFSGLKTALITALEQANAAGTRPDVRTVAHAFQEAAVDVVATKAMRAAQETGCDTLTVSGGVAANRRLRARLAQDGQREGIRVILAPPSLCTDNAAMIAGAAWPHVQAGDFATPELGATARLPLRSWR